MTSCLLPKWVKRQNLKVGSRKIIPQTQVSVVITVKYCIYMRASWQLKQKGKHERSYNFQRENLIYKDFLPLQLQDSVFFWVKLNFFVCVFLTSLNHFCILSFLSSSVIDRALVNIIVFAFYELKTYKVRKIRPNTKKFIVK